MTTLMAVGADDVGDGPTEVAVRRAIGGAAIAAAAGFFFEMPRVTAGGVGALLALLVVKRVAARGTVVAVAK